ncbi:ecotin family protein [Ferrimonas pelagia]|uniref:Ecotin n=1 Tax=Ferrimonas pelagia TaxID=1177826 RepID=A0ABP9EQP2_9GAMM
MKKRLLMGMLMFAPLMVSANEAKEPGWMFEAKPELVRHIFHFPAGTEVAQQVEIQAYTVAQLAPCNSYRGKGELSWQNLQGWGYGYGEVTGFEPGVYASTLAACPDLPKEAVEVMIGQSLQRHSGQYPLVVYAPEGVEIRARRWQPQDWNQGEQLP